MQTINLSGPQGNAYFLLGLAESTAKQLDIDPEPILKDMMSGDYENLCKVFNDHFHEFFELELMEDEED